MEKIKIQFDPNDNSLLIWFADPQQMAYLSPIEEDTPSDFHIIKDEAGKVIDWNAYSTTYAQEAS
jgi:hypothetical protein